MYVTNAYRMDEDDALAYASSIGYGQFITNTPESGFEATVMPFVLKKDDDGTLRIQAHYARVNRQWENSEVFVIVQGPTAYVSGLDQPAEPEDAKMPVVPSLDYIAVHFKGKMQHREGNHDFATQHLMELVRKFDDTWRVGKHSDPQLVNAALDALVAVDIEVTEVTGKWKLHQGLSPEDIEHTARSLRERGAAEPSATTQVADLMDSRAVPWARTKAQEMKKPARLPLPDPSRPRPSHVYKYDGPAGQF